MNAGAGVADLRASHERQTVNLTGRGSRAACTLRDVFINFAILIWTGTESLHRRINEPRIELTYFLLRKAHAIDRTRREILNHDIGCLDKLREDLGAGRGLGIERNASLVGIQHREIEAVHSRNVPQLAAGGVALTGPLDLYDIGAEPGQNLSACRSGLHVCHVHNPDTL